jgi:DNA-directed RNA polymerase subunit L
MKVVNIEKGQLKFDTNNKFYSKVKDILPLFTKSFIKFTLVDTNEAFANAIRRVFNDELVINTMHVHPSDITTNDKFILPDNIVERLSLIPINQSTDKESWSIRVDNESDDIIKIWSSDIKSKSGKIHFNQNIQLCSLRPNKHLYISNILSKGSEGFHNNANTMGTYHFSCPIGEQSMADTITTFDILLQDNSNSSPSEMINLIHNCITMRLKRVRELINNYEIPVNVDIATEANNNEVYIVKNTKIVDVKKDNSDISDLYEIHIKGEYHTIGNLITRYVFNENPDIELVNYKLEHILKHKIIVTVCSSDYKKIIYSALTKCIEDFDQWKSAILAK